MSPKKLAVVLLMGVFAVVAAICVKAVRASDNNNLNNFQADGTGMLVEPDTATQTAALSGNYNNETISFTAANQNPPFISGPNFVCAFKSGTATIQSDNGTIDMFISGSGCQNTTTFQESIQFAYLITGGTGQFVGAGGTGTFSWGISNDEKAGAPYFIHISGNITQGNH